MINTGSSVICSSCKISNDCDKLRRIAPLIRTLEEMESIDVDFILKNCRESVGEFKSLDAFNDSLRS